MDIAAHSEQASYDPEVQEKQKPRPFPQNAEDGREKHCTDKIACWMQATCVPPLGVKAKRPQAGHCSSRPAYWPHSLLRMLLELELLIKDVLQKLVLSTSANMSKAKLVKIEQAILSSMSVEVTSSLEPKCNQTSKKHT